MNDQISGDVTFSCRVEDYVKGNLFYDLITQRRLCMYECLAVIECLRKK